MGTERSERCVRGQAREKLCQHMVVREGWGTWNMHLGEVEDLETRKRDTHHPLTAWI